MFQTVFSTHSRIGTRMTANPYPPTGKRCCAIVPLKGYKQQMRRNTWTEIEWGQVVNGMVTAVRVPHKHLHPDQAVPRLIY